MIEEIQDYAIILLSKDGIIQEWNKGAEKIKLYKEEEIIGKHFSIFYFPEDIETNLPNNLINTAASKGSARHEGWRRRKDGSRFWGSITITALHGDQDEVIGFVKITRDLSEKKAIEDDLRTSEERYHKMISEVQDYAIILLNKEGVIENWNAGAQSIKGYAASEVIGKNFELFYTPEDRKRNLPASLLNEARNSGKAVQEGWRVRKDGTRFWGTIVITALHGHGGEVIGFSKVTRDLTQKRIAEEQLLAYAKELEQQNSELEQFAYVASHDLQEPLRKIQTFSEVILDNFEDRELVTRYFGKLNSSAKRMAELVKSLLNYSRLAKDTTETSLVDLDDILEETKIDFELLIEEKKAVIESDNLPAIHGNHIQLGQLFSNLISNALKFSSAHPKIYVTHSVISRDQINHAPETLTGGQFHHICIADNGIGFEQQYGKIIFSLFQRLHGKQEFAGTGIGLALCKKIIENHHGFISAEGELGKGSSFNIYLPV
ncbi:MAG: PAS domain S-box protein [Cyclobacteriaceae bacterium]|nr:PAS domain S-box protein [Cyclobacteriaceae bacterium]